MKCRACNIEIERDSITQHYQDAFHTENLRRKELGMPPVEEAEWSEHEKDKQKHAEHRPTGQYKTEENSGQHKVQNGECLFCGETHGAGSAYYLTPEYIKHLQTHGFYFAAEKYITDVKGLMKHLVEKIEHCECMYCSKRFSHIAKTRAHMKSMGHMRYAHTDEYDAYYTYPEQAMGYISEDGAELTLPSGRVAGHKKYQRYYDQTLREEDYYKNLDPLQQKFEEAQIQRRQDTEIEESVQKAKQTEKTQREMLRVSRSANNQKHYRDDWMQ